MKYQYFNRGNNTKFVYLIGKLYTTIRCQFVDTNKLNIIVINLPIKKNKYDY
jgi:hypothetical protein